MNLKDTIKEKGLKQKKIAKTIGLSPEYLNQMLNGKMAMSPDIEQKIKDILIKVAI